MKKLTLIILVVLGIIGCGRQQPPKGELAEPIDIHQNEPGDSTLYGLACDGTTDSILVLLPLAGGDPDTFDIINAHQERHIYGRPHIGDKLAVILNPEDKQEVLMLVNMERLKGKWCYEVMPTFRNLSNMPERIQRRMLERIPDSMKQKLMTPREYGYQLKNGNSIQTIGAIRRTTTDDMSPVEYPAIKRYVEWRLYNGKLILTTDSLPRPDGTKALPERDTADVLLLRQDTLVLRIHDHEQGFYRK